MLSLPFDGGPQARDKPQPLIGAQNAVGLVRDTAQIVEHQLLGARAHGPIVPEEKTVMGAKCGSTVWRVSESGLRADGDGFSAWLRGRSDAELTTLLAVRPDLVSPAPTGVDVLASRATKRLSLERALDDLDQFALHVLDALAGRPEPTTASRLQKMLAVPSDPLHCCLTALRARALTWETCADIHLAPGLRAAIGEPTLGDGQGRAAPEPPPLRGIPNGSREVNQAAADAALSALRATAGMLSRWGVAPVPVLKSGGLGIRELRKAAASVDVDLRAATLYTEVARAAGLLAASGWTGGEWLPSRAFDAWRDTAAADQWAALASAWLAMTRVPALVGARDEHGGLRGALGAGLDRVDAPRVRSWVLGQLATVPPGESVSVQAVLRRLAWRWPRGQHQLQAMLAKTAMAEAAQLGLTGLGALSAPGRALVLDGLPAAAAALAGILPEPVDYVVLQADMTAVAPGPLGGGLDRELTVAADVESTGGATVYRFSADSVRRALDAGRSGEGLLEFLQQRSRTPVPQPLRYLIEDVARRHGQVRVGGASSYIRSEDAAVLAEIAADRRAAALRLRLLAPTVLVSLADRGDVIGVLRKLGYSPAAESADGAVEIITVARRAEDRSGRHAPTARQAVRSARAPWPVEQRALAAVRVLRAADR